MATCIGEKIEVRSPAPSRYPWAWPAPLRHLPGARGRWRGAARRGARPSPGRLVRGRRPAGRRGRLLPGPPAPSSPPPTNAARRAVAGRVPWTPPRLGRWRSGRRGSTSRARRPPPPPAPGPSREAVFLRPGRSAPDDDTRRESRSSAGAHLARGAQPPRWFMFPALLCERQLSRAGPRGAAAEPGCGEPQALCVCGAGGGRSPAAAIAAGAGGGCLPSGGRGGGKVAAPRRAAPVQAGRRAGRTMPLGVLRGPAADRRRAPESSVQVPPEHPGGA